MQASVRLEHHLLAVEGEHRVHAMFELAVPGPATDEPAPPLSLALVLDRSGSMAGEKLATALRCADWLASHLRPVDRLALVTYDDEVALAAPLGPAAATRAALRRVAPGGSTNLSGGWLKGVEQLRGAPADGPRKVLLLTDGLANVGVLDRPSLVGMAGAAGTDAIGTSTIGFGGDFDEDLLTAMADAGGGNAHWAPDADAAPAIFAAEHAALGRLAAQNMSIEIRPREPVELLGVLNEYPAVPVEGGIQVQLGDGYGGERRRVVFELWIPRLAELGPVVVADVVLRYVSVGAAITAHEVTIPVVVGAVSAAEAAAAGGDPEVREEVLVLRAAAARDRAVRLADAGDLHAARSAVREVHAELMDEAVHLPPPAAAALQAEAAALDRTVADLGAGYADDPSARKRLRYDSHARRRRPRGV